MQKVTLLALLIILFTNCKKETDHMGSDTATLTTDSVHTEFSEATVFARILSEGKSKIVGAGIVWAEKPTPTVLDNFEAIPGFGTGSFSKTLPNLKEGVNYYVRAYATNAAGTTYGNELQFTTKLQRLPVVEIDSVDSVGLDWKYSNWRDDTETGLARFFGHLTDNGSSSIIKIGFCWNQWPWPTLGAGADSSVAAKDGRFTLKTKNLKPWFKYYVRAFAINSTGVTYSQQQLEFTTPQIIVPTFETLQADSIEPTTAVCRGKVVNYGYPAARYGPFTYGLSPLLPCCDYDEDIVRLMPGSDFFSFRLKNLISNITYYFRAEDGQIVKLKTIPYYSEGAGITDGSGKHYETVKIKNQEWFAENLKTVKYANGDPMVQWVDYGYQTSSIPYNTEPPIGVGYHYSYRATTDPRNVCPAGWHVATRADWNTLLDNLGGAQGSSVKLRNKKPAWYPVDTLKKTNSSGLKLGPFGVASISSCCNWSNAWGSDGWWWLPEQANDSIGKCFGVVWNSDNPTFGEKHKANALSVRCVKD
jgi:uncharacterized protein (TIGR02145 family)